MISTRELEALDASKGTLMAAHGMFDGGGEMGSRMRSFDWSKTAIGPVAGWSQALKTMVGVVLRSPSAMYLAWGPQLVQLYNDAYQPHLGAGHPILGQPAKESWPEVWHMIGPNYAAALAGLPATWSEDQPLPLDRNGFVEETYFKAAFIPVPDETTASGIGGVLATVVETTEQVYEERQRKTLREIAARAAGSHSSEQACATTAATLGENPSDVPFCLFYLLGKDGQEARLVAQSGFGPESGPANPEVIDLTAPPAERDVGWPLGSVVKTGAITVWEDLPERFKDLPKGRWSQPPRVAIALPLASPDQPHPYGVIIAGVNPHRELDDGYQAFFELVAGQVVTAMNAEAVSRAHADAERDRTWLFAQLMQAPVSVCVLTGPEFVFSLANPLSLQMVNRKEMVGRTLREVYPELEAGSPVFQVYEGVFSTGLPFVAEEFRVAIDKGNGPEDMFFKFTAQPIRDMSGKVTDIMAVSIDITAHVLARRRIEALVGEMRQADQRKDEFLATLAHELRNPLAAISMSLSLLENSGGDPAKGARHQATARRQMQGLTRLVNDLLDISRISRGTVELRKERISLATIVHNAAAITRAAAEARGHRLEMTEGAGPYLVDADATRIEQVVVNLLTNAAKYTDPGGTLSIRLDREEVSGTAEAVLRVRDTGRGIPADMLENIFDLFVQVVPSLDRSTGGLGVGLTLVKRMVELHGGTVRAHSEGLGRGSELVVRLPLASDELPSVQIAEVIRPVPVSSAKRRVLVVEDVEDVRKTFEEFLTALGHEVSVAVDGLEGVAKILELLPDVSFVDVGLPGIDGYEVARRVRASPGGDQLYLVAVTGYDGSDAKEKVREAGFNLHLTKPVDGSEVANLVSSSHKRGPGSIELSDIPPGPRTSFDAPEARIVVDGS